MIMSAGLRKLALTAHVTASVGWLDAVDGFLALAVAGLIGQKAQTVCGAYLAMELTARFVIVTRIHRRDRRERGKQCSPINSYCFAPLR